MMIHILVAVYLAQWACEWNTRLDNGCEHVSIKYLLLWWIIFYPWTIWPRESGSDMRFNEFGELSTSTCLKATHIPTSAECPALRSLQYKRSIAALGEAVSAVKLWLTTFGWSGSLLRVKVLLVSWWFQIKRTRTETTLHTLKCFIFLNVGIRNERFKCYNQS